MRSLVTLPIYLIVCCTSFAEILPIPGTQSVTNLFRDSDIVCNCSVQSISVTHNLKSPSSSVDFVRQPLTAVVRVADLYKGDPAAGNLLSVDLGAEAPVGQAPLPSLSESEVAVLFLKKSGSGYSIADPFLGATRFAQIPLADGANGIIALQSALIAIVRGGDRKSALKAMTLIQGMDEFSPDTTSEMVALSRSTDADLALSAIAVLVKADPAEGVDRLQSFLADYSGDDQYIALQTLSNELMHIVDARALPALESLSSSKFLSIRFGSMLGLRAIRSPRSTTVLAQRLDDTDGDIRCIAVMALAEIYQKSGDYAPSSPLFDSDPKQYTDLWRRWLQDPANKVPMSPPKPD